MLVLYHCLDDGVYAVIFPVKTVYIPLYGKISAVLCHIYHRIVVIPIRRPEQEHFIACQLLYFRVYLHQLFLFFLIGQLTHVLVVFTVVSQVVSCCQDSLHIVRIALHPSPRHKKRDMYVMFFQNFQNFSRILIPPREQ